VASNATTLLSTSVASTHWSACGSFAAYRWPSAQRPAAGSSPVTPVWTVWTRRAAASTSSSVPKTIA
jgi:hypothetical protein